MKLRLLIEFTKRDFTERYSGSILGVGWSFISPLVNIMIYTLIFSKIMSARMPGVEGDYSYSIYLVSGLIPWLAFANTVSRSSTVYLDKKHIISKVNLSLFRLPMFIVISETITFLITMAIFLGFLLVIDYQLSLAMLILPFIYVVQQIFAFALGFIIAQLTVFIRDLKEFTAIVMQIWFWFTPIVYVVAIVPGSLSQLMVYNPVYSFIKIWQSVFVYHSIPDLSGLMIITLIAHCLLIMAFLMYRVLEKDIRDFL
ncbi:ABC transporter permease [Methyloprofundus sp.]|uniref:ABC transporter permease n=1 Tax=Methyloprofundus sp. TaxID=2020875 RepID=UPI00262A299E|nr:ABC transporter permease [Methyloprofundus sp.]